MIPLGKNVSPVNPNLYGTKASRIIYIIPVPLSNLFAYDQIGATYQFSEYQPSWLPPDRSRLRGKDSLGRAIRTLNQLHYGYPELLPDVHERQKI